MVSTNPAVPAEAHHNNGNLRENGPTLGLGLGFWVQGLGLRPQGLGMPVPVGRRRKCEPVSVAWQKHFSLR